MRIVQGQNVGQSDQCSYSLHLFEQSNFGIHFLGDLLDAPIVFRDALVQRLRKTAVDMEVMAARDGDLDFPDELVLPFIINALTDNRMLKKRPAAAGFLFGGMN
jgi:hypothetical protein